MKSVATSTITIDPALAHSVHGVAAHASEHAPAACLNCGTLVADRFCGHCGQDAHHTHRLTLRFLLLHDLPHSIWHIDKGIGYTFRQMITRPGATLHAYMAGRRAQHFRPISYLLLICAVCMLLLSAVGMNPMSASQQADMPQLVQLTMERYLQLYTKYPTLIYIVLLPGNALLATWLLRPARFNFAEMLLGQAFVSGTTTVISTVVMLPMMLLTPYFPVLQHYMVLGMLPYMVYTAWVYRQLLEPTRMPVEDKWVRSIGTVVLQTLLLFASIAVVYVAIIFSLVRQDPTLLKELQQKKAPSSAARHAPAPQPTR
ncbi:DUF3667 domain-containing protein [Hymenobacter sp. HSC-4F20]|uniref:DUF3667 domain-containing protein n=1 Tax=Hymenobacter sp. HSC-4F20 TaxID=2864135 RepID=UPI001C72C07B|nr:DUF3667 domain-containing protein [Hymenobacter sp. HSC-4F20]MBX0288910.1 DUF3667 domain-containing protein [Hymenobacter sp. HSC-4F20]